MHPLDEVSLKLEWANHHLETLQQAIQAWRKQRPYEIVGNIVHEGDVRKYLLTAKVSIPIHSDFSLLVGDICNNARSALDYTLWQLWLLTDPAFDGIVYFPICDSLGEFNKRAKKDIRGLTAKQRAIIEELQPYNTGSKAFSILRDLNNSDKHRRIQFFAVTAKTETFEIETLKGYPAVGPVRYRIAERVEIKDGAILAELQFPPNFIGTKVQVNTDFSFTMAFRGSKSADGLNVDTTLQGCIAAVHDALLQLEGEFPRTSTER